jgi:excisionase family DNA binding protein
MKTLPNLSKRRKVMDVNYSTKQIACMLRVDEETVRRWVRTGKLKGDLNRGRKGGFQIKESDLEEFIRNYPKYQKIELEGPIVETYALASLNQRIFDIEELISNLKHQLDGLVEIRDMLTKKEEG